MAYNKSKTLESALKFLQQGKLAQAISEYQQVLKYEPKDQSTLMTLGDLFVRQGDTQRASDCFERLANVFLHDGFNSKAIAIYKKIAKLAPAETSPLERLAELYVQQGVLSEARPLYLQLAEIYLKGNRGQQAVESLRKLLEVEPDNHRVQLRLAELYQAMGQKKEAALVRVSFARRLLDRGELDEAQKLVENALAANPGNAEVILLKAQIFSAGGQAEAAIALLEGHSDSANGGEMTTVFLDLLLKSGKMARAVSLTHTVLERGPQHHRHAHKAAAALLEAGQAEEALKLLGQIRDLLIESGEQEQLGKTLLSAVEKMPGRLEPLEWLVDLYRKTSDSFRLPDAMRQLADAYASAGDAQGAERLYEDLLERNPDNEDLLQCLNRVRTQTGREPVFGPPALEEETSEAAPASAEPLPEPALDEETQRYVSQALTDVDLFSSYGLTQKAIQLLETVLQRAPRHTATLERLLDLYLGAGDERRTAEIAARLEHLHAERGDTANAERFGELQRRFQRAAGISADAAAAAQPPATISAPPAEFVVTPAEASIADVAPAQAPPVEGQPHSAAPASGDVPEIHSTAGAAALEVDLTDDWAALAEEVQEPIETPKTASPAEAEVASAEITAAETVSDEESEEFELELVPTKATSEKEELSAMSQDQFLNELAAEVEDLERMPAEAEAPAPQTSTSAAPAAGTSAKDGESLDQLREVFQDFRTELEEIGEEEDLETHYNLGIAYREMGLLDEAIGEFQKVANGVQGGRPFRYAMQCSTLLGLTFMAKNEPKIAAVWYQRALETPGLDQESILALRYDLGVAQELAGDGAAALESFRLVYAMNIDYRDVAERIAALQKN